MEGEETPRKLALTPGGPKLCCVVTIIAIIALLYHLLVQLLALLQKRIGLAFIEKRGQRH